MESENMSALIGQNVEYYDYTGQLRFGRILFVEPVLNPQCEEDDDSVWCYIEDEDVDYNVHDFNGVAYAELRLSREINLIENKEAIVT